jgi:DNA-binding transcriptional MerR regulator
VLHDKSLLPPPELRGRTGWYDDRHVTRVRLVLRLQERGFTLNAIGELIKAWESGRDLSDVLGLEDALTRPWNEEPAGPTTTAQLEQSVGQPVTPEQVRKLEDIGVLERDGDAWRLPSPALVASGIEMVRSGLPLDDVIDIGATLRADLRAVAGRLTDSVAHHLTSRTPEGLPYDTVMELVRTIDRLRDTSRSSVAAWFGLALDEAVADYVSSIGSSWSRDGGNDDAPGAGAPRASE